MVFWINFLGIRFSSWSSHYCINDGLSYWSIYTSLDLNELPFASLKQTFGIFHEKEQASTQDSILILQLQFLFGSGKEGFQRGSFVMKLLLSIQVHVSADRIFCTTEMTMNLVSYVKSCQEACDVKMMLPTIMNVRNQCIKSIVTRCILCGVLSYAFI